MPYSEEDYASINGNRERDMSLLFKRIAQVVSLCVCVSPSLSQTIEIPTSDTERHAALGIFLNDFSEAVQVAAEGDYQEAIERLHGLYDGAEWLHPHAAAQVADRLGVYYATIGDGDLAIDWLSRSLELVSDDVQDTSPRTTRSQLVWEFQKRGQYEQAARVALATDVARLSPENRWATLYQGAQNLVRAGLYDEAVEVYHAAEQAIAETSRPVDQQFDIRVSNIRDAMGVNIQSPDSIDSLSILVETYQDPVFVDVPGRLNEMGRVAVAMAYRIGDRDLVESLTLDLLSEAARLELMYGREHAQGKLIPEAYVQSSSRLASLYREEGREMEALELLESAIRTYPECSLCWGDSVIGQVRSIRDQQGLSPFDPDQLEVTERFGYLGQPAKTEISVRTPDPGVRMVGGRFPGTISKDSIKQGVPNTLSSGQSDEAISSRHTAMWAGVGILALATGGLMYRALRK